MSNARALKDVSYDELLRRIDWAGVAPGIGAYGQGFQMEESPAELAEFLQWCWGHDVRSMLEIGTGEYGGLARFCTDILSWDVTSIDHRTPLHLSGRFIFGESHDPAVYEQAAERRYDLVFIDACHAYEDVKRDYAMYAPLADCVVAFHDIAPNREGTQGVGMVWNTIKGIKREAVDPAHPIGIGWYEVERV